jgi:glycolate oxidase FAD binding subunit
VLGVIAEVSLKVPPVAAARQTLAMSMDQRAAIDCVQQWTAAALPVRASAWQGGTLHLRLEGAQAAVQSSAQRLLKSHAATVLEPGAASAFWSALRDQTNAFFSAPPQRMRTGTGGDETARESLTAGEEIAAGEGLRAGEGLTLWRLSVPPAHPPLPTEGDTLVEWGGALRWTYSDAPARCMREMAARAGGHATAFRGAVDRTEVFDALSPPLERIHRNLKAAFDPAGIFNPGRLYPWL